MKDTALHFLHIVAQNNPNNQFAKAIFNRLKNAADNVNLDEWQLLGIPFDTNITLEDFDNTKIEKNQDCRFLNLYLKGFRKFPFDEYYGVPFCPNDKDKPCPPSTLIQGCNGSGKTSVFSALEYLFIGKISAAEKQQLTKKKEGEDNNPYEIKKDYIPYRKKDIKDVIINVTTKSSQFSFGPKEQLQSNLSGLCLAPFFCSEYDFDNLLGKGLSDYIYEQMGYGLVKKIIEKLDEEIEKARKKHDGSEDSKAIKIKVDDLDRKIGVYKRLRDSFWYIVSGLHNEQDWKKLSENITTELSKDFIIQENQRNQSDEVKLLNETNLKNERKLFDTLNLKETYFTQKYLDLENAILSKSDNLDPLVPFQSPQHTIEEIDLEEFNNERRSLKDIIEKILANADNNLDIVSLGYYYCRNEYDEIINGLESEKKSAEDELSELAIFDQYDKNRDSYDGFLASLKSVVYGTINKITVTFKGFVEEVADLFLMDDETMSFDFDSDKGEFTMTIKLNNPDDGSSSEFQPRAYLNTFRYKLYCMTLKFAIAFIIKRFYKLDFPIVIDDIFYSSDFSHRNMVRKYFRMLFKKHNELFTNEEQQLQVIFFSHDELLIEAAYRGIRDFTSNVNCQFLYDYREAGNEDYETISVKTDSGQKTIKYTKLTDSLDV